MKRQYLVNILFLISLNVLIKPFWILGIDRSIQNTVGSEEYGIYFALFGFSFLLNTLLDFGVTNYNTYSISRDTNFLKVGYKKLAILKLGLGLVYIVGTLVFGLLSGYSGNEIYLLFGLALAQFLLSFILFQRSVLAGLQIFWLDSIFSVLDRLLLIGICGYLLWFIPNVDFKIEWLVYAQIGAYAMVLLLISIIILIKKRRIETNPAAAMGIIQLLKQSVPFALIILFMTFYYRIDAFMIERILEEGAYKAGVYAQSFRLFDVANNFVFLFTGLLFPMLAKAFSKKENVSSTVKLAATLLLLPALFFIPIGIIDGNSLLNLLYINSDATSYEVLILLSFSYLGLVLSAVYGTVLTASGKLSTMISITAIGFVLNLFLNLILIKQYGITGAAFASAFVQVGIGVSMLAFCRTKYLLNDSISWLIRYFLVLLIGIVMALVNQNILIGVSFLIFVFLVQSCLIFALRLVPFSFKL